MPKLCSIQSFKKLNESGNFGVMGRDMRGSGQIKCRLSNQLTSLPVCHFSNEARLETQLKNLL